MSFPIDRLAEFYRKSNRAVRNSFKNSKRFENLDKYEEIEDFLSENLNGAETFFYGSRTAGNANHYSDLDIFVDMYQNFDVGTSQHECGKLINLVKKAAKQDPNWVVQYPILYNARIPVLRCIYLPKRLTCEYIETISFKLKFNLIRFSFNHQVNLPFPTALQFATRN